MNKKNIRFLNSFALHLLAMAIMLVDHLWGTVVPGHMWMTCVGRLAFPIFAFLLVEGYYHTRNLKNYFLRLLGGAILSEIPFNLMMSGGLIDPFEQNVYWTFLIGLGCIALTEKARRKGPLPGILSGLLIFAAGTVLGFITFVDYSGYGVLMVGCFYAFRRRETESTEGRLPQTAVNGALMLLQAAAMYWINAVLFRGMMIDVTLAGRIFEVSEQGLAVFALLPIWLYNGQKGPGGRGFQLFCYLFYPAHILILSLCAILL